MSLDSIRVNELAKELNLTNKEVLEKFAKLSIPIKTHSSAVTADQVKKLKDFIAAGNKIEAENVFKNEVNPTLEEIKLIFKETKDYSEKKYIEYKYRSKLSDLYNHIPLKDFSDYIGLTMGLLEKRIKFMKDNQSIRIFDYAEIENKLYVIVDDELKHYLKNYTAFIVHTFKNYKGCEIKFSKLFSTYIIGFY